MPHIKPAWLERIAFDIECFQDDLADPEVSLPQAIRDAIGIRGRLAWAVNDLGQRMLNLSTRILKDCPSSFDEFWNDGWAAGRDRGRRDVVELWVTPETRMDVIGQLVLDLGMDTSAVMAHLKQQEATR